MTHNKRAIGHTQNTLRMLRSEPLRIIQRALRIASLHSKPLRIILNAPEPFCMSLNDQNHGEYT
jgi:hypothetical protein